MIYLHSSGKCRKHESNGKCVTVNAFGLHKGRGLHREGRDVMMTKQRERERKEQEEEEEQQQQQKTAATAATATGVKTATAAATTT